jgi:hypothetical protein
LLGTNVIDRGFALIAHFFFARVVVLFQVVQFFFLIGGIAFLFLRVLRLKIAQIGF